MPKVEPVSGIDAAWLAMEHPTNLMMVSGIMTFPERLSMRQLKKVLRRRFLKFDRFRQRVVQPDIPLAARPLMPAYWEWAEDFDLDDHLFRVQLPEPAGPTELRALVSELMSTPLDFSKPLWEMHLIENLGEGSGLMVRLHHCIADGMALVHVLLSIADADPEGHTRAANAVDPGFVESTSNPASGPLEAFFEQIFSFTGQMTRLTERVVKESIESLTNPTHLLELAKEGTDSALAAQRLFLRSDDPETVFKGPLGESKLACWSRALPLPEVKEIKHALGGTVNDALIAAMTGALRKYLQRRGEPVDELNLRATVPVNLRKDKKDLRMGNRFGLVFLSLPVGTPDPLKRLEIVSRRMNKLKQSREAPVIFGLLSALGGLGREVQMPLVNLVGAKATFVMTNMIGPPVPLYLAGCKVDEIMFWVPQSARLGVGISILSYNNKVRIGVATDAGLVPDPERIVEGFHEEYERFRRLAKEAAGKAGAGKPSSGSKAKPSPKKPRGPIVSRAELARQALKQRSKAAASPGNPPKAKAQPARCRAKTKQGARCRNRVPAGQTRCHVHSR